MDNLTPEQIKQMIGLLQSMLPESNEDTKKTSIKKSTKKTDNKKTTTKPKRQNKFDAMAEARMHKDDVMIDKKLNVLPPVPRARPFELVKVRCRVCGKQEKVNPSLVIEAPDRYKCNKCCASAG